MLPEFGLGSRNFRFVFLCLGVAGAVVSVSAQPLLTAFASMEASPVSYSEQEDPTAMPFFSLAGGTYSSPQTLTLADATPGAHIYYTTNGLAPTTASTLYLGPISVGATQMVRAVAIAPGYSVSRESSKAYTFVTPPSASAPYFSLAGGSYKTPQTLTLTDATPGATIYYTTNGTTPTTASTKYTGPITIKSSELVIAVAAAPGYANSNTSSKAYKYDQ
jgi:hypothetical protein